MIASGAEASSPDTLAASFHISRRQFLDPEGEPCAALPRVAEDGDFLISLYRGMALARAFAAKCVSGSGGAGATTFATALGQAAATSTHPVTLIDVDPVGAGAERVAGLDDVPGAGWASLLQSAGRLGSRSLRSSLPYRDGMAVLGWGDGPRSELAPVVVREVLSAARRGSSLVVVDLPRHPTAGARELLHRCDVVVVVTLLRLPALAATARVVADLLPGRSRGTPAAMVVTRGPASALDPREVAETLGLPLAAAMTDQRRLAEAVELGTGPLPRRRGPLFRAARSTLKQIEGHAVGVGSTG